MADRESPQRQDFEEMEAPRYLQEIDIPDDSLKPLSRPSQAVLDLVQSKWTGQLGLIDKSLEELEAEDESNRQRLTQRSEGKDKERSQLLLQQQVHTALIGAVLSVRKAVSLVQEIGVQEEQQWNNLLKQAVSHQRQLAKAKISLGKLRKTLLKNHSRLWPWYDTLCQEWTLRAGLATGINVLVQAEKEAEVKRGVWEDAELMRSLAKELKTDETALQRQTKKKPKHRLSKHRKLKFDVHEKLLNFMPAEVSTLDPRSEQILNSLFGRKQTGTGEPVLLDIPLI